MALMKEFAKAGGLKSMAYLLQLKVRTLFVPECVHQMFVFTCVNSFTTQPKKPTAGASWQKPARSLETYETIRLQVHSAAVLSSA